MAQRPNLSDRTLGRMLLRDAVAINGLDGQAEAIVNAVEVLTCQPALLGSLTLLTWRSVIASRGLLRSMRAYCPYCYQEMQQDGGIVSDRLVWAIGAVQVCLRHHVYLLDRCANPRCWREMPVLGPITRPGFCPHCGDSLGSKVHGIRAAQHPVATETHEGRWEMWVARQAGDLVAVAPRVSPPGKERVASRLHETASPAATRRVNGTGVRALAQKTGQHQDTVRRWLTGVSVPSFPELLRLCAGLGVGVVTFLTGELPDPHDTLTPLVNEYVPMRAPTRPHRSRWSDDINQVLEAALAGHIVPPPSVHQLARRLECDAALLTNMYPKQCARIAQFHGRYERNRSLNRMAGLAREVDVIVRELTAADEYPSQAKVIERLATPAHHADPIFYAVWESALEKSGWTPGGERDLPSL